ncbi:hypothetical protein SKAU_G00064280 [Synaphobranchus kaupii]|uniref:Glucose transporter 1 n=1 Tax=Synaphobranchus kaupii TaxID=118154 RepID=A0A9Q1G5G2_SYNKA|nr:hypothetical protein SKAU_G00064280 [Synaphobranchus kaupii]
MVVTLSLFQKELLDIVSLTRCAVASILAESRWNFLFAFLAFPALLQLCILPFLPESPRFLLMERRDEARAEKAFQAFLGKKDVTKELEEVHAESRAQTNLRAASVTRAVPQPCRSLAGDHCDRHHGLLPAVWPQRCEYPRKEIY